MISLTPKGLWFLWKQRKFWRLNKRGTEEIFTDVYKRNVWGGEKGNFFSGYGSVNPNTDIYIKNLVAFMRKNDIKKIVDLGCGDFRVMKRVLDQVQVQYIGLDVVKDLIQFNSQHFGNDHTQFRHVNIIEGALPEGDLVLIRQVLQHLSNEEISKILKKLSPYRWALISEHLPVNDQIEYNIDKIHGPHVRMKANSGVFIDKPPFNVKNCNVLFEYREDETIKGKPIAAVIRTYVVSKSK